MSERRDTKNGRGQVANFKSGDTFAGSYRVISLIGQGGMGAVYRVHHMFLNREFALKTIPPEEVTQQSWQRFQLEAKSVAKLEHRNMVKIYDLGVADSRIPYYVMDLLEGESLSERLKRSGSLPVEEVLEVFAQVAEGLAFAHERGFVHRDIKPANIMLTNIQSQPFRPVIKILDFGIAKLANPGIHDGAAVTQTGQIFGSPLYMSPEQCRGAEVDPRSDVYSMGCAIYETLTGAPPFMGDTALVTMVKHQKEVPLKLREASMGRDFPHSLEVVVERCLAKDKLDRYQSAVALANDLRTIQAGKPIIAASFAPRRVQTDDDYDDDIDQEDDEGEYEEAEEEAQDGIPKFMVVAISVAVVLLLSASGLLIYVLVTGQNLAP